MAWIIEFKTCLQEIMVLVNMAFWGQGYLQWEGGNCLIGCSFHARFDTASILPCLALLSSNFFCSRYRKGDDSNHLCNSKEGIQTSISPYLHYVNKPHKSSRNEVLLSIRHEMFAAIEWEEIACRLSSKVWRQFPHVWFWNEGRHWKP